MTPDGKSETRKAYSPPSLQAYGNLRALTQNVNPTGMGDGSMAGNAKT